ncbi:acyl-CoA carboxylase subunit epsilon [Amycolatopsis regifaucium]|uniref:Acetyl-CoA carboxylase biotin carboxyl carrier protein subunit n=1 Tax=Amycolatopsis regifaucium TaxID=546365 RepID=A0A154MCI9_9PSEU|nr:acyl-CoA carboxylase subunit epsilon [Amycolatopsis regifaucium]KZB82265.1 acetyl-CoA carboxylase biotin carboxyl carrier protein subunit [Amycolatopsis regifaucium]OKA05663.1 acetyl-CoA carboxylase biotin carboxyl carrier protein subunit [Amycolatopsis regifaucium]SFG88034.1 Acyl-CoA carboxylase epsilon subunit [Amycolatopsis regifaucium]
MSTPETPLLRVVRGNPSDAELAALTAVVVAVAGARAPEPAPKRQSWWADKASLVRAPLAPGEGAWKASALPR